METAHLQNVNNRMNMRITLYTPLEHLHLFFQFADALIHSFAELGHKCKTVSEYEPCDVSIILCDILHESLPSYVQRLKETDIPYIIYFTEPCTVKWLRRRKTIVHLANIHKPLGLWTYSHKNVNALRCIKKVSIFVYYNPPRYSPVYDYELNTGNKICCIINHNAKGRLFPILSQFPDIQTVECWSHKEWKQRLQNTTVVNIHKRVGSDEEPLEMFRIAPLLSSGICVISERSDPADMEEFSNVVAFARLDKLAEAECKDPSEFKNRLLTPALASVFEATLQHLQDV